MPAQIRLVEPSDVERLGELHSAVWAELYPTVLSPAVLSSLDPATMAELWGRFISRGEKYVQHVAVLDGEIVGFVGTGPGREAGYELGRELYFIYVQPQRRRSAIGKALLRAADADYLWVAESNRPAQQFYRKQKFFPDSVRRVGALFGAELPELRMAR
jgi:ribosomal protein S18 acetylase RimI-like enzyme